MIEIQEKIYKIYTNSYIAELKPPTTLLLGSQEYYALVIDNEGELVVNDNGKWEYMGMKVIRVDASSYLDVSYKEVIE